MLNPRAEIPFCTRFEEHSDYHHLRPGVVFRAHVTVPGLGSEVFSYCVSRNELVVVRHPDQVLERVVHVLSERVLEWVRERWRQQVEFSDRRLAVPPVPPVPIVSREGLRLVANPSTGGFDWERVESRVQAAMRVLGMSRAFTGGIVDEVDNGEGAYDEDIEGMTLDEITAWVNKEERWLDEIQDQSDTSDAPDVRGRSA